MKYAHLEALVIASLHLKGKKRIQIQPTHGLNTLTFLALWSNMKPGKSAGYRLSAGMLRGKFLIFGCNRRFQDSLLPQSLT